MSTLFNVRRLDVRAFAQAGELLSGQASLSEMPRLHADCAGVSPDRQIQWSAKGGLQAQVNAPAKVWLQVKATTALPFVCQRCLEPVEITVAVERDFRFVSSERLAEEEDQLAEEDLLVESREFDLLSLIEDELLMEMPLVPRHTKCPSTIVMAVQDSDFEVAEHSSPKPFAALAGLKKHPGK